MRTALFPFFFIFLTLPSAQGTPTSFPTPTPMAGPSYSFESNTVWGHLKVLVRESEGGFLLEAKGDNPLSGWSLKDERTGKTLSKGALRPLPALKFKVQEPFQGPYRLTVHFVNDREEVPVSLRLRPGEGKAGPAQGGLPEGFQPDPDRPFNSMVRSLYEKALDQYSRGDKKATERTLLKAEEMDPENGQVTAFLRRVREERDPLRTAPAAKGGMEPTPPLMRKTPRMRTQPKPTSVEPREKSQDRAAKADRTYNLGLESYRQRDLPAAKKFWEETLSLDPAHAQAKRNLERLKRDHPGLR